MASGKGGAKPRGGKKGRKVGKGVHKLAHSRWGNYENLFAAQRKRRAETHARHLARIAARRRRLATAKASEATQGANS